MGEKINISNFNPQLDILKIKGKNKRNKFKEYKEKYIKLVLDILSLKNDIYGEIGNIQEHNLDVLKGIIIKKRFNKHINKIIFKIINNLKNNIEKAGYIIDNIIPELFIKYHFEKEIKLIGEVRLKCIIGAIIIEFEKKEDFYNYTGYEKNIEGLYYNYSNVIAINGFNDINTQLHELQHYKSHEIFNYFGDIELKNLIKHHSISDEFLARSLKINFGKFELEKVVLAKDGTYLKGKNTDYEIEKGKRNYELHKKLEKKYGKDFIKIANITNGKRLEWFL